MSDPITLRKPLISLSRKRTGGGSRAVIIPVEWLDHWKNERNGKEVTEVDMTLGEIITIKPVLDHQG